MNTDTVLCSCRRMCNISQSRMATEHLSGCRFNSAGHFGPAGPRASSRAYEWSVQQPPRTPRSPYLTKNLCRRRRYGYLRSKFLVPICRATKLIDRFPHAGFPVLRNRHFSSASHCEIVANLFSVSRSQHHISVDDTDLDGAAGPVRRILPGHFNGL